MASKKELERALELACKHFNCALGPCPLWNIKCPCKVIHCHDAIKAHFINQAQAKEKKS